MAMKLNIHQRINLIDIYRMDDIEAALKHADDTSVPTYHLITISGELLIPLRAARGRES